MVPNRRKEVYIILLKGKQEQHMEVIQTEYNGYRFRSRLEARWAVAFDAMGIEYEYEPEGFVLKDGSKYLPDFKLLNIRHRSDFDEFEPIYIEVKGIMSMYDMKRIEQFPAPLLIIGNIPSMKDGSWWDGEWYEWSFCFMDGDEYSGAFCKYGGELWFAGADHDQWDGGNLMRVGLNAARKARFEHGEHGYSE